MLQPPEKLEARLPAVAVTERTEETLRRISKATGISVSELVRRSIDLFLSENANEISNKANADSREQSQ